MAREGYTLRSFCRAVELDPSFFSKVLAGKRSPPSDEAVLRRIAAQLGLDGAELIVSAGRIPQEWSGLWTEPGLFALVHETACGRSPRRQPQARPAPAAPAAGAPFSPRPPALADELL